MDSFGLEVTVRRVGGVDNAERSWGPRVEQIQPDHVSYIALHGFLHPAYGLSLQFGQWHIVRPGLLSTDLMIKNEQGFNIGPPRPVLLSTLPSDLPLYSTHIANDPDIGLYSVGLRIPRYHWMPADLVTAEQGTPRE